MFIIFCLLSSDGTGEQTDISTRATYGDSTDFSLDMSKSSLKPEGKSTSLISTDDSGIEDKENNSAANHSGKGIKGPVAFSSPISAVSSSSGEQIDGKYFNYRLKCEQFI